MKLGVRLPYDPHKKTPWLPRANVGVELALPYQKNRYLRFQKQGGLQEVIEHVNSLGLKVLSVHATQGPISDSQFLYDWGPSTAKLADKLSAETITVHPNNSKARTQDQRLALEYLVAIQEGTKATWAAETFGGGRRVLYPEEIIDLGFPMVLDVAHLSHERSLNILQDYIDGIVTVHLSAQSDSEQHLPVDAWCLNVACLLRDAEWRGEIILEYLPWHHYRILDDLELLRQGLSGKNVIFPPPDPMVKAQWKKSLSGP